MDIYLYVYVYVNLSICICKLILYKFFQHHLQLLISAPEYSIQSANVKNTKSSGKIQSLKTN